MADGLELQRTETSAAKFERAVTLVDLANRGSSSVRMQGEKPEQVMRAGAYLPAASVHFRAAISESLGVARRDKRRKRSPNFGRSKK